MNIAFDWDYEKKCYFRIYDNIIEAFSLRIKDKTLILNDDKVERALLLMDVMFLVHNLKESVIEKHLIHFLTTQNLDSGELFDSTIKNFFVDLTPKQRNFLQVQ